MFGSLQVEGYDWIYDSPVEGQTPAKPAYLSIDSCLKVNVSISQRPESLETPYNSVYEASSSKSAIRENSSPL